MVRAASKEVTPDDPPTEPLPETHELGEGQSDFSNWVDPGSDVSVPQALGGFGFIMGVCAAIYQISTNQSKNGAPLFTRREFPTFATDVPTLPQPDVELD